MPNQHTAAARDKRTQEQRDAWKEKVQIGALVSMLERHALGQAKGRQKKVDPSRIKAAEVVLDRFVAKLSSTEITEVNELDTLTREDILARIQLLLKSDPSLLPELVALQAREAAQQPVESLQPQQKSA